VWVVHSVRLMSWSEQSLDVGEEFLIVVLVVDSRRLHTYGLETILILNARRQTQTDDHTNAQTDIQRDTDKQLQTDDKKHTQTVVDFQHGRISNSEVS